MTQPFINLKEKLISWGDGEVETYASFNRPFGKESNRRREKINRGTHTYYDKYTPINTSQEKIEVHVSDKLKGEPHVVLLLVF